MKPTLLEDYENSEKITKFLHTKLMEDIARKYIIITKETTEEQLTKYSEYYDMWRKSSNVSINIGNRLYDCSELPTYVAKNMFATLLTYVEGERFIPHLDWNVNLSTNSIVAKETKIEKITNDKELEKAIENGDAITLYDGISSHVLFYDRAGESHYNAGKFEYVVDFIYFIIQKSYYKGIKTRDMEEKDLDKLLVEFLKYYCEDLIELNKEKRKALIKDDLCVENIKILDKKIKQN